MGHVGQVRALEVTHGRKAARNNGWHPHFHILQFCYQKGNETDRKDWAARLYVRWAFYCEKSGLGTPSYAHGIKLDNGEKASDYVTKWGLEDEMTKGHTKKAKAGGETPFDLLRAAMADRQDKQAMALFRVRGVLQGQTSVVLVKQSQGPVFVDEKTDQELAAEKDDRAVLLGLLTVDQWRDVLKVDGRGVLLDIAAKGGWHNVQRYLWLIEGAREGVRLTRNSDRGAAASHQLTGGWGHRPHGQPDLRDIPHAVLRAPLARPPCPFSGPTPAPALSGPQNAFWPSPRGAS